MTIKLTSIFFISALLLLLESACVNGFAAKNGGFGKNKASPKNKKKGAGGGRGVAFPPKRGADKNNNNNNNNNNNDNTEHAEITTRQEIILGPGRDKIVYIHVPPNALSPEKMKNSEIRKFASASAVQNTDTRSKLLDEYETFRGRGDVVWPSSLHLSRLVANCPSFVTDRNVIDLGCGLGLASLATLLGKPKRLVLSDVDELVLDLAIKSCNEMIANNDLPSSSSPNTIKPSVERMQLDWTDPSTWPQQSQGDFDVALASDVLYDEDAAKYVAEIIAHLLHSSSSSTAINDDGIVGRALIVDPANRENRDAFVLHAARNGLLAEVAPFPGQEDEFVLINVTPITA